jgi:hypothetical protein
MVKPADDRRQDVDPSQFGPRLLRSRYGTVQKHCITALATILVVAAGATAHHFYETRLSSGYGPILQATMSSSYEERAAYIHEAQVAVRTDKAHSFLQHPGSCPPSICNDVRNDSTIGDGMSGKPTRSLNARPSLRI